MKLKIKIKNEDLKIKKKEFIIDTITIIISTYFLFINGIKIIFINIDTFNSLYIIYNCVLFFIFSIINFYSNILIYKFNKVKNSKKKFLHTIFTNLFYINFDNYIKNKFNLELFFWFIFIMILIMKKNLRITGLNYNFTLMFNLIFIIFKEMFRFILKFEIDYYDKGYKLYIVEFINNLNVINMGYHFGIFLSKMAFLYHDKRIKKYIKEK